jgi:ATP-dependent DNA helicase RecG
MEERRIGKGDALALIERGESHFWDHKSAQGGGAMVQKIGGALANADGGEFIVGVEDRKSRYVGLDRWRGFRTQEEGAFVLHSLARDLDPPVPYTAEWLLIEGEDQRGFACLVTVQKSDSVHVTASGVVWVRQGPTSVELTGQSITDLSLAKGARSYEDQLLRAYTVVDLATETELAYFLRSYSPQTEPADFAIKQRIVDRDSGMATVAGAILYADNPPAVVPKRCGVKVARYETTDAEGRRDHLAATPTSIEGPARQVIESTLREVTVMIESVSALRPDGTLAPLHYPPEALKEIVVNAIVHRDYNVSDDIRVFVFDNRVEVRSPGKLPGHMTLNNLLTQRFARNPTVVRLLNKYPDPPNKDIGEGLRTTVAKMMEAKLKPPQFAVEGNDFVVRLGHTPLARPHEIVLDYLSTHDDITNRTARGLTGILSDNTMKDVFKALREAGQIEMVPGKRGRSTAWRLVAVAPKLPGIN